MATIYTKTALKKIKKDELIQMFLDKQGKLNDIMMEHNEVLDEQIKLLKDKKELLQENKKLKEENEKLKEENVILDSLSEKLVNENEDFKEENVILNSLNASFIKSPISSTSIFFPFNCPRSITKSICPLSLSSSILFTFSAAPEVPKEAELGLTEPPENDPLPPPPSKL